MWSEEAPEYGREVESSLSLEEDPHMAGKEETESDTSEKSGDHVENSHYEQTQPVKKTVRFTVV